jgi:hypothetical protein
MLNVAQGTLAVTTELKEQKRKIATVSLLVQSSAITYCTLSPRR